MPRKLAKSTSVHALSSSTSTSATTTAASSSAHSSTLSHAPPLPRFLTDGLPLPRLVVFDLDYTLWPFWVDTHVSPPLKAQPGAAVDKWGEAFAFYPEVPRVLHTLALVGGVKLGVASRTHAPDLAREMLKLLHVAPPSDDGGGGGGGKKKDGKSRRALDLFDGGVEMYPGSKLRHLETLSKRTGVAYGEILFFDDESRNRETEELGVTMWLIKDGVTWDEVERGVGEWRKRKGISRKGGV